MRRSPGFFARGAILSAAFLSLLVLSCADGAGASAVGDEPYTAHEEAADFVIETGADGKSDAFSSQFDPARVVSEGFFTNSGAVTGDAMQAFFEATPYGTRCWLADETLDGARMADVIVDVAVAYNLNPIILLTRMQVERSLISKNEAVSAHTRDFAFGCGCYDGQDCLEEYRGLDKQLACAATTLSDLHAASVDGSGVWKKGKARRTLDDLLITPFNHASASLYGYTPWVLQGTGGNWLVWNITRKYAVHFERLGFLDLSDPTHDDPWVGRPCQEHLDCLFEDAGQAAFCLQFTSTENLVTTPRGFCSLPCEGYCPDLAGAAPTFCVSLDEASGFCAPRAHEKNAFCEKIPGTSALETERFIGTSNAYPKTAVTCMPPAP